MYAAGESANAYAFNSVQRAHQNFLEALPIFSLVTAVLFSAAPKAAAAVAAVWLAGRVVYFEGASGRGPWAGPPAALARQPRCAPPPRPRAPTNSLPHDPPFPGYAKHGPSGRLAGALVSNLTQLGATLTVLVWGVKALLG